MKGGQQEPSGRYLRRLYVLALIAKTLTIMVESISRMLDYQLFSGLVQSLGDFLSSFTHLAHSESIDLVRTLQKVLIAANSYLIRHICQFGLIRVLLLESLVFINELTLNYYVP